MTVEYRTLTLVFKTGKGDALQRTMDSTPLLSNGLKTQSVAESNKCTVQSSVKEDIDGCMFAPFFASRNLL